MDKIEIWDSFLKAWPISRVKSMTLSEYTNLDKDDSFTYCLEAGTQDLGSIWGGSSFKFGIFKRKDTEARTDGRGLVYSNGFGWYQKYGDDKEQAFAKIKTHICTVIEAVRQRDLSNIDRVDLGDAYKWKIAFLYQDRNRPSIVNIYSPDVLRVAAPDYSSCSISEIHTYLMTQKGTEDILCYGESLWNDFSKQFAFWKVSHGKQYFNHEQRKIAVSNKTIIVHQDTRNGKEHSFEHKMAIGDYVYLCNGNDKGLVLLGKVLSDAVPSNKGVGWLERRIDIIKKLDTPIKYKGINRGWAPNNRSTCKKVSHTALSSFQSGILFKYFKMSIEEVYRTEKENNIKSLLGDNEGDNVSTTQEIQILDELPPCPPLQNRSPKGNKIDYIKKQKRAMIIGDKGERIVVKAEQKRLREAGFEELASKVKQVSLEDDSLGYDILSYEANSSETERLIEVKSTTRSDLSTGFYLSANEYNKSTELENYWLYIVLDVETEKPKLYKQPDPFSSNGFRLEDYQYRVFINNEGSNK